MSDYTEYKELTTIRESIAAFLLSCKLKVSEGYSKAGGT